MLYACRHGQDEDNAAGLLNGHRNTPLTALGREQAAHVADKIASEFDAIDAVYCSPLQRAKVTAETICEKFNATHGTKLAVTVLPELIERDFGAFTGKPLTDILTLPENCLVRSDKVNYFAAGVDGIETFQDLRNRAAKVLEDVRARESASASSSNQQQQQRKVLLVCHGDIMKMMLAVVKNLSWREGLLLPYIANTEVVGL